MRCFNTRAQLHVRADCPRRRRVVLLSDDGSVRSAAQQAGAVAASLPPPGDLTEHVCALLHVAAAGSAPAAELGDAADVVVLHLSHGDPQSSAQRLQTLLKQLDALPDAAAQLYMVLLLGRGSSVDSPAAAALPAHLAHLRPRQSFQPRARSDGAAGDEAVQERALLCVHRLEACVRRDDASRVSAAEFVARGARGTILMDDILAEVAYKVGRAPKFGA